MATVSKERGGPDLGFSLQPDEGLVHSPARRRRPRSPQSLQSSVRACGAREAAGLCWASPIGCHQPLSLPHMLWGLRGLDNCLTLLGAPSSNVVLFIAVGAGGDHDG